MRDDGGSETGTGRGLGTSVPSGTNPSPNEIPKSPNPQIPKSPFLLLLDPPASGAWNMAVDEVLWEAAAAEGQPALRFYQWQEPTLSLGYFQTYADRWQHEPSSRAAVVRRPSGGGAIMHDVELTYSVAVPSGHPLAKNRLGLYQAVHTTLIETLACWGIKATMVAQTEDGPRQPFLCFQRRSPGDVLVGEHKIAGSAQRRSRGAVLQHGSVLLGRSIAAPELDGLRELVDKTIRAEELTEAWLARLAGRLAVAWHGSALSEPQRHRAATLAAEKYGSRAWTESRWRG
jgi:lipoate-protein ligase A